MRLAAGRGLHFTAEELGPVVSLLRFLADLSRDSDLRDQVARAGTPAAVLELAQARGYSFSESEMSHLTIVEGDRDGELSDDDLAAVAGGTVAAGSGIRVQIDASRVRQTPKADFGALLGQGLSAAADAVRGAVGGSVPGGAIISAAISG